MAKRFILSKLNILLLFLGVFGAGAIGLNISSNKGAEKAQTAKTLINSRRLAEKIYDDAIARQNAEIILEDINHTYGIYYKKNGDIRTYLYPAIPKNIYTMLLVASRATLKSPARLILDMIDHIPLGKETIYPYTDADVLDVIKFISELSSQEGIRSHLRKLDEKSIFHSLDHEQSQFTEEVRKLREMQAELKEKGYQIVQHNANIDRIRGCKEESNKNSNEKIRKNKITLKQVHRKYTLCR